MFTDIEQIKRANIIAGKFFFSAGALRFFDSRVSPQIYPAPEGAFFITSERFDYWSDRAYTVYFAFDDGEVVRVSDFQQYRSRNGAHRRARALARLGTPPER